MKNKKGVSAVIITLILVVLAIVMVGIVWTVVKGMTEGSLEESQSCFNVFGKIEFNKDYVCYNATNKSIKFGISRKDIELDKIVVTISGGGASTGLEIPETTNNVNLRFYNFSDGNVQLPGKNSGLSYIYNGTEVSSTPDSIILYPVINGKQCEAVEEITEFENC